MRLKVESTLNELASGEGAKMWIGQLAPYPMACARLFDSSNFRLAAEHHGAYDSVWCCETLLSDLEYGMWQLALDELVRLVSPGGHLILKYRQNRNLTNFAIKSQLWRRANAHVELIEEDTADEVTTSIFKIERESFAAYSDKRWSFVVLAQGDRTSNVVNFLKSIEAASSKNEYEVLISGPEQKEFEEFSVRYLQGTYSTALAEVSKKKRDAIEACRFNNVCILHDRYVLHKDFFLGFEKFGYDFDFVAVRQAYETGDVFPFYCATADTRFIWSTPIKCQDFNRVRDSQYVNGGFMVFKRESVRSIGFNPLLLWGQAEDVELSRFFFLHGMPPRVNLFSLAVTSVTPKHTSTFVSDREFFGLNSRAISQNFQRRKARFRRSIAKRLSKMKNLLGA
jgi:hypothetical protein